MTMSPKEAAELFDLSLSDITKDQINKKYRILSSKYHPDRVETGDADKFVKVCAAKDALLVYVDNSSKSKNKNIEAVKLATILRLKFEYEIIDNEIEMKTYSYKLALRLFIVSAGLILINFFFFSWWVFGIQTALSVFIYRFYTKEKSMLRKLQGRRIEIEKELLSLGSSKY